MVSQEEIQNNEPASFELLPDSLLDDQQALFCSVLPTTVYFTYQTFMLFENQNFLAQVENEFYHFMLFVV